MGGRSDHIADVRSRISSVLLVVLSITAIPALAASLYRIATIGWLPIMAVHVAVVVVLCLTALLRNRIQYRLRAAIIVFVCVLVGLGALWQLGLQGHYFFAVVAPAVCAIFFGARIGVAVLVASLLAAGGLGAYTVVEQRLPPFDPASYGVQPSAWVSTIISWAMVAAALLAAVVMYNKGLYAALTEAKQHEASLRSSEERFRNIVENSPNALSLKDLQGRYLLVNERFEALFGGRRENVIGRTDSEIFEGIAFPSGTPRDHEVVESKLSVETEEVFDSGGRVLNLLTKKFPILDRDGNVTVVGTVHTDITGYRRAEEDSTQLGRILEDSPLEIYSIDVDTFRFVRVNRGARENLGYSIDELRELTPADIAPNFDPARLKERVDFLKRGEQDHFAYETVHQRKDGTTYPVRLRLQLVTYQGAQQLFGIAEDITERLRTEAQLQHAQKMEAVGQLTGGVAHDFNNLLSVILGNLELIQDDLGNDADSRDRIRMAVKATERGAQLTQRLLAFSRRQRLRPQPVDAGTLLDDMLDLLRRSLGETIEIEVIADSDLWTTEIDPGQLENALLNLAINARDAMPGGGKLTITTSNATLSGDEAAGDVVPGDYVLISVSDTGEGMTAETREHVFDPFFTTKEARRGTGLGLSMVYGFVKQSGGHIVMRSELGVGTTVHLYLRRYRGPRAIVRHPEKPDVPAGGNGEVILLVEDDADLRAMTLDMLRSLHYEVIETSTGRRALEILDGSRQFSLLLTDLVLPEGLGGRELADRVLQKNPDLSVLYMSGYSEDVIVDQGRLDKGVQLLEKPFRKSDLARAVRQALDAQRA